MSSTLQYKVYRDGERRGFRVDTRRESGYKTLLDQGGGMDRVRFIEHRGHRVLLLDYSGLRDEQEMLEMIEERTEIVSREPRGSVLTLADLTGSHLSREAMRRGKEANVLDQPFVRRAALVGAETLSPKGAL